MADNSDNTEPKTVNWKWAVFALLVVPCCLAVGLNLWLGVSRETYDPQAVFAHLGLQPVTLEETVSYEYSHLFFSRFKVAPSELSGFLNQLDGWTKSVGLPQEPVSFKLKRDWWDMDQGAKGDEWDRDRLHLFRADSQPDVFYAVVELGR